MATPVEMPQLGNTVEECVLTRWLKQEGDSVSAGDLVAEIETDKTTFEIAAPVDGTVLATFFDEGALVPVFTNILVIGDPGESVDLFRPGSPSPDTSSSAASAVATVDTGRAAASRALGAAPAFSPRAARFAARHDFHPASIVGSGPGGRVLEQDLKREHRRTNEPTSQRANEQTSVRSTIARRMRESLASTAQYTMHASADASGLLALRARIKQTPGAADITIGDLVTFCTIQALVETPDLNAEFIDGRIMRSAEVHMGFACDTPKGLVAPVVRSAQALTIAGLAARMKALAAQAIDGTIAAGDLSGATFTVSNLGGLGIESFTPLINPPQVAILGVGAVQLRPVRRHGGVEFVESLGLSLTCDHQVIDGAPGARFLQLLREKIEQVEALCRIS